MHWRSYRQLVAAREQDADFQDAVAREFPEGIEQFPGDEEGALDGSSRRSFLAAVAASVAFAGLTSCRKPKTGILPFNRRPEGYSPGLPQFYATTMTRSGYGIGVLVKSSDGRPTKIEGNPDHPSSLGGCDARLSAELLQIYDPQRSSRAIGPNSNAPAGDHAGHGDHGGHGHGEAAPAANPNEVYSEFFTKWDEVARELVLDNKGAGLHVLMPATTSPSMLAMVDSVRETFAQAQFYFWDPIHRDNETAGAIAAYGKAVEAQVDFKKARIVASFDCDFLATDGNNLRNSRDWADTRRAPAPGAPLSRLYAFESCFSTTGTAADHRFRMTGQEVTAALFELAAELGVNAGDELGQTLASSRRSSPWAAALAADLRSAAGNCAVVVGPRQPAAAHAVAHAINQALGAVGVTIAYTALPKPMDRPQVDSIRDLAAAIDGGRVKALVCLGTNPVYDAPADLEFGRLLREKAPAHTIHAGLHHDETAELCTWHFPLAHELESWGDARAHDGTMSLQQPLIEPLYGAMSPLEFLAFVGQQMGSDLLVLQRDSSFGLELLREYWMTASGAPDFDTFWTDALLAGHIADTKFATETVTLTPATVAAAVRAFAPVDGFEVQLRPCPKMWDGRYANNSWMQELPDPLTKLTWDNAALIGRRTAERLGVENGDFLTITAGGRTLQAAAWILPGHAEECATVYLGWGRRLSAEHKVAHSTGFDGYALRTTGAQWLVAGATVAKTKGRYHLVCTQEHGTMAGRDLVREADSAEHQQDPEWAPKRSALDKAARLKGLTEADLNKSLWTERYEEGRNDPHVMRSPYQWGMVIDLNACTGCSACITACVAENNIPMVGKTQVARNREMFWIRADRYFTSAESDDLEVADNPGVSNMPVPCMQCENAPCESVCPVAATTHSPDGLNDMVYNRCIGTRYCSNNCPYKVRRYNYLDYLGKVPDTKQMAFNPDVTVRSRGVMEKCTYCVQRINGGRISAKLQGKMVGDGADDVTVTTACAQACPTKAITFGNIIEQNSAVATLKANTLNYGLLSEMNTKPRTTYLGRVRNPNPALLGNG